MKYFVTDRRCGLGDALLNLAAAWWLGKKLERDVIIDWSKLPYTVSDWSGGEGNIKRYSINLFPSLFKHPDPLEGVSFHQPEQFRELFFCDKGGVLQDVNDLPLIRPNTAGAVLKKLSTKEKIIRVRPRAGAPFDYPGFPNFQSLNRRLFDFPSFFAHLQLQDVIKEKIDNFHQAHFNNKRVIGIHLRHGSGEAMAGKNRGTQAPEQYARNALAVISAKLGDLKEFKFFICSDDKECEESALDLFPNSFNFPKTLPSENDVLDYTHERHQNALHYNPVMNPIDSIQDSLIDLILLSRCDILAGSKNSAFTILARSIVSETITLNNILYT